MLNVILQVCQKQLLVTRTSQTCVTSYGHPRLIPIADHYQVPLTKVIGTDDIHRDEIMMLEGQLSQLTNKRRWCCLAQNLIHLSMQSLTNEHANMTHWVKPDTWGKAQSDHEGVGFISTACVWSAYSSNNTCQVGTCDDTLDATVRTA